MTSGNLQRGTKRNARCNERQVASHTPEVRLPVADFFPAFKDGDDGMEANITHTLLSSDGGDGDIRMSPNEAGQGELT